jgi:hypothetical protein
MKKMGRVGSNEKAGGRSRPFWGSPPGSDRRTLARINIARTLAYILRFEV